ncbi:MAG: dTDP-4-dehydrorhamnose reductase [Xanthomonadales bacterium]|nr:dTDP-4-dehydrorhamnose reductase [Xanthomonadales bacterium]
MNILLAGASGQLGQELLPKLQLLGRVISVDRQFSEPGEGQIEQDLADLNRVEILLNRSRPDLVVNAAAYTAVDRAESDPFPAFRVNAELPGCLARWVERNDRLLLHYSTDYVFDGESDRPYVEQDLTGPRNVYGESKLAGEWAIAASRCRYLLLRTSWVYSSHGNNFVLSMLRLASERSALSVVSDQIGCPTWARNLARVSVQLVEAVRARPADVAWGIYHYCDASALSWYDFARAIFGMAAELGLLARLPDMTAVNSVEYPQVAERPLYSVLDTSAIGRAFAVQPASLKPSLRACLEELKRNDD